MVQMTIHPSKNDTLNPCVVEELARVLNFFHDILPLTFFYVLRQTSYQPYFPNNIVYNKNPFSPKKDNIL